jgi:hypothetical protein
MIANKARMDLVIESEDTEVGNLYISGIQAVRNIENLEAVNVKAVVSAIEERILKQIKLKELLDHAKVEHLCIVIDD